MRSTFGLSRSRSRVKAGEVLSCLRVLFSRPSDLWLSPLGLCVRLVFVWAQRLRLSRRLGSFAWHWLRSLISRLSFFLFVFGSRPLLSARGLRSLLAVFGLCFWLVPSLLFIGLQRDFASRLAACLRFSARAFGAFCLFQSSFLPSGLLAFWSSCSRFTFLALHFHFNALIRLARGSRFWLAHNRLIDGRFSSSMALLFPGRSPSAFVLFYFRADYLLCRMSILRGCLVSSFLGGGIFSRQA